MPQEWNTNRRNRRRQPEGTSPFLAWTAMMLAALFIVVFCVKYTALGPFFFRLLGL